MKSETASSEIILWPERFIKFFIFLINSKIFFTHEIGAVMLFEIILL